MIESMFVLFPMVYEEAKKTLQVAPDSILSCVHLHHHPYSPTVSQSDLPHLPSHMHSLPSLNPGISTSALPASRDLLLHLAGPSFLDQLGMVCGVAVVVAVNAAVARGGGGVDAALSLLETGRRGFGGIWGFVRERKRERKRVEWCCGRGKGEKIPHSSVLNLLSCLLVGGELPSFEASASRPKRPSSLRWLAKGSAAWFSGDAEPEEVACGTSAGCQYRFPYAKL